LSPGKTEQCNFTFSGAADGWKDFIQPNLRQEVPESVPDNTIGNFPVPL
jgi:hypothetical protein